MSENVAPSVAGAEASTLAALIDVYDDKHLFLQYAQVQFITEQLLGSGRMLQGDYTWVVILAVLGQRSLESVKNGDDLESEMRCMSASRISDITCVPRETVRRKLQKLESLGLICQRGKSGWCFIGTLDNSPARRHFADEERGFLKRLAKFYTQISCAIKSS